MKLTDYYLFEKLPDCTSKLRYDCTASTGNYEAFELLRNKKNELFLYYGDMPNPFNSRVKERACKVLSKTKNISSVFVPDLSNSLLAYGDVRTTNDALLLIFNAEYTEIQIFVARGFKNNALNLWRLLADGELADEIECLKSVAKPLNLEPSIF